MNNIRSRFPVLKQAPVFPTPLVFPFSDYNLISYNLIMALGHVAVALKDTPDTTYSILQFFVQIFCRRPSDVDVLIVDQMGCMVLARSEVRRRADAAES